MQVIVLFECVDSNGHRTSKFDSFDCDVFHADKLNAKIDDKKLAILESNPVTVKVVNTIGFQIIT